MRTLFENTIIFGLPYSAANVEKCQRAGVAFLHEGLTVQQRQNILNGTTPISTVLQSPESKNFQAAWSSSANGSTRDWLIGELTMRSDHWARLQAWIGTLPNGLRYVRAYLDPDNNKYTILETNVNQLQDDIGRQYPNGPSLLRKMGLVPYYIP